MKQRFPLFISLMLFISVAGICASFMMKVNDTESRNANMNITMPTSGIPQSAQNPDRGVGPIKSMDIGALNTKMADEGKNIFNNKCLICHDLDQKKIGPALRNIVKERTPEYLMNLMVNYAQMLKEDPILKSTFKKFNNVPMTDPALNQAQARSVLEYLRSVAK